MNEAVTQNQSHSGHNKDPQEPSSTPQKKRPSFLRELINIALIAAFVVLPIRLFVAQPFIVSGSSMDPTFENGDYLIVDQLSYRFDAPERFQVIIFRFPNDPSKFFIKRIIGLPEEVVHIKDGTTTIYNNEHPNGIALEEPYAGFTPNANVRVELGPDEYFVMGDNRNASSDSRSWGPLPGNFIIGKAFARLLPIDDVGLFPGLYTTE